MFSLNAYFWHRGRNDSKKTSGGENIKYCIKPSGSGSYDLSMTDYGGIGMVMERINVDKARRIAEQKGLKPGRVKGTGGVQFTKGRNDRLEIIDWPEFERTLKERGLQVYESGGWMKIMKKD